MLLQEVTKEDFKGENENPKAVKERFRKASKERQQTGCTQQFPEKQKKQRTRITVGYGIGRGI